MGNLVYINNFIKPARSTGAGFSRIKKIPYQAPPTHFWKKAFLRPKYQC